MKKRLDILLKEKGLVESREKAKLLIKSGFVYVDSKCIKKIDFLVDKKSQIEIKSNLKYVSRAGFKLESAIDNFKFDVKNKICLDIGASTGGFTDCLLQYGASLVYAVDVGYGQLAYKLRQNEKVKVFEKLNARYLKFQDFNIFFDIIVCDVSFISVKKLLNVFLSFSKNDTDIIILFKPQFEAPKGSTVKGVIKDKSLYYMILIDIIKFFKLNGIFFQDMVISPIKGRKGNIEFLLWFKKIEKLSEKDIVSILNNKLKEI